MVGIAVGGGVGAAVGALVGITVGTGVGIAVGAFVGKAVGAGVGTTVGACVGTFVGDGVIESAMTFATSFCGLSGSPRSCFAHSLSSSSSSG